MQDSDEGGVGSHSSSETSEDEVRVKVLLSLKRACQGAWRTLPVVWRQDEEEQVSVHKGARRSRRERATVQRYDPVLGTDRPQPRRGKRGLLDTLDEEVSRLLRLSTLWPCCGVYCTVVVIDHMLVQDPDDAGVAKRKKYSLRDRAQLVKEARYSPPKEEERERLQ